VPVIEQRLRTNDLRPRWFDARRSMIFPVGRTVLLLGAETPMAPEFAQRFPFAAVPGESGATADGTRYTLYDFQDSLSASQHITSAITSEVASSPQIVPDSTSLEHWRAPVSFGDTLTFLGYEDVSDTAESGSDVVMLSYWRVEQAERWPLAIFVHVLSPTGDILGQDDGLAVAPTGWYPGDVFVQLHRVTLDETPAEGPLWVQLGLYRTDTLDRLPAYSTEGDDGGAAIGDRLLLLNLGEHAREESRLSE
ncbi:MAG: hypothetical protein GX620_16550, partial [Chloroflexi bacterium]|nr:hypothetical protein [Chloroflexota bacterium]